MSDWFLPFLALYIGNHRGAILEAADEFGCTPGFVSGVLSGRKRVPDSWLTKFYLHREDRFVAKAPYMFDLSGVEACE